MRAVLEQYSDNPVIDELVGWTTADQHISRIRASMPMIRKPFIEISLSGQPNTIRHFSRDEFISHWAEASVILELLTDIELVSEFDFSPPPHQTELRNQLRADLQNCIRECETIFDAGLFQQYLDQFGNNCRSLPEQTHQHLLAARQKRSGS